MATAETAPKRTRRKPNPFDALMKAFGLHGPSVSTAYRAKVYMQLIDGLNNAAKSGTSSFAIRLAESSEFGEQQVAEVTRTLQHNLGPGWCVVQTTLLSRSTTFCWHYFKPQRSRRRTSTGGPKS